MKETDKESSSQFPLEVAHALEELLRGTILVFLRFFYTIYQFLFTRRQFPLTSKTDPLSPAIIIGPITFSVFSWILYLFVVHFVFLANAASSQSIFQRAISILSSALVSGSLTKFLLSISPLLILVTIVATLQQIVCRIFGSIISFSTNLAISGYVIGAYAAIGSLVNVLFLPSVDSGSIEFDSVTEYGAVVVFPVLLLVWGYKWFRLLIEHAALSKKKSVFAIFIVIALAIPIVWGGIESVQWILSRNAS